MQAAIKALKNNKAPGDDMLAAELFKTGSEALFTELYELVVMVWNQERIPKSSNDAVMVNLYKKGDKELCGNYRGLSLLSTLYKIIARVIYHRLLPYVEPVLGDYQAGFRNNRSTSDQIFSIRQVIEKRWEFAKDSHIIFVDFKQAYDCLHRESLWKILAGFMVPTKLINIIKALYNETTAKVKVNGGYSDPFPILSGVRQGCLLSPCLFNLALEWVVRQSILEGGGVTVGRLSLSTLAYADDIALLSEDMQQLEQSFDLFRRTAERIGLLVNENKTKIMHIQRGLRHQVGNELVAGLSLERVNKFVYLGSEITPNNDISGEVERRISSATRAFYALGKLFKSRLLSRRTKLRLLNSMVLPVLTFGAETWSLTQTLERKILRFENDKLKTICGPIFDVELGMWRRRYAREVRALTQQPLITDVLRASRLRWLGHILRAGPDCFVHRIFLEEMEGRRPRGRPRTRWRDVVGNDLELLGVDLERVEEMAEDRSSWRRLVVAAKGLNRPIAPGD